MPKLHCKTCPCPRQIDAQCLRISPQHVAIWRKCRLTTRSSGLPMSVCAKIPRRRRQPLNSSVRPQMELAAKFMFVTAALAFLACWAWALVCLVRGWTALKRYGPPGQSILTLSTSKNMTHPAYPFMRGFLFALACGAGCWVVALGLGLGFGFLH